MNELRDYKKADELYNELVNIYPDDSRCWYGLLVLITHNFCSFNFSRMRDISKYYNNYLQFEKDTKNKEELVKKFKHYLFLHTDMNLYEPWDYEKRGKVCSFFVSKYPDDSECWLVAINALTVNFTDFDDKRVDIEKIDMYYNSYLNCEKDIDKKNLFIENYNKYKEKFIEYNSKDNVDLDKKVNINKSFNYSIGWIIFVVCFLCLIAFLFFYLV